MKKILRFLVPLIELGLFSFIVLIAFLFPDLDRKIADLFQRPLKPLAESHDVVMINVDDGSVAAIGNWPFGRDVYAGMLDVLKDFDTEAVVFDLSFLDKSQRKVDEAYINESLPAALEDGFSAINTGICDVLSGYAEEALTASDAEAAAEQLMELTESTKTAFQDAFSVALRDVDSILADSIQFFDNTYLTLTIDDAYPLKSEEEKEYLKSYIALKDVVSDNDTITYDYKGVIPAISTFMTRGRNAGFVNAPPDKDGYLRRLPIVLKIDGAYYGQLMLVPILNHFGNPKIVVSNAFVTLKDCKLPSGAVQDIKIPRDEKGYAILKYPPKKYKEYNFISLWNIYRLSLLDEQLFNNVQAMQESGFFALWDGTDPVEAYQTALQLKKALSTTGENEAEGITYENYAVVRASFYGAIEEFLSGNQEQLLIAEYGEDDSVHEVFATVREQFAEIKASRQKVQEKVSGAICIVGTNATSTTDFGLNQYQENYPNPGAHYTFANQLLSQDFIDDSPLWLSVAIAALLCCIFSVIALKITSTGRQIAFGIVFVLLTLAVLFGYFFVTKQYIGVLVPVSSLLTAFAVTTVSSYLSASSEKKFITNAFSQCLSKEVVDDIVANPSSFKLGGQTLEMSAMFTDIQKFSGFSELLSAGQLVALLNFYLTKMSDIIMAERGTVDKYEGDAIIALVGAPVQMADHAERACAAAIKMKKAEVIMNEDIKKIAAAPKPDDMDAELYEAFKIMVDNNREIFTRIGLNSGEMVAGYMGSENKKNYTMMGNNVNLASRLEGVNKQYSTGGIMISEATRLLIGERFVVRSLDRVRVVNVNTPIRLYELIEEKDAADEFLLTYVKYWEQALQLFEAKEYAKALAYFRKLSEKKADDKVALYYISLIENFFIKGLYPTEADDVGVAYNPEDGVFKLLQK